LAPTKICKEVQEWIDIVEQDKIRCCEEQHLLVAHIKKCFETEDIYTDTEQLGNYIRIIEKYLPFKLFPWEKFVLALHDCTYWTETKQPRWPDLFCMTGRGAGKDGMIAAESLCLSSQYNGIREYDVDICANNEEQALRPVQDLKMAFEEPKVTKQIKRFYHWTKERIVALKTRSIIRGRTNSPKGKDGLRSGIVIFNEIHQYQNYDNINVFTTGLGKKKHPRRSYYTTNGDVREGPLDDILEDGEDSLRAGSDDNGTLYFICKLNKKDDVHDEANWTMANPSLPYLPHLQQETRKEYREWVKSPERLSAFISKRMNLTDQAKEGAVTSWDCIAATNKPIPELTGRSCTIGIDYAKTTDWVAVNVHFKDGDKRYDINKAWICGESKDIPRIKAPWREWAKTPTMLEYVDDVEIHPETVAAYVKTVAQRYKVEQVAIDSYRYTLMADALSKVGFSPQRKNLILVKQTDILKVVPVIDHCFIHGYFHWGDNPVLRWATNNTKLIRYGRNVGADKGSFVYAKIEAKSRKTDPWMALVASMVCESEIKEKPTLVRAPVITL
jgi:phage terminase large subunit-like protein